MNTEELLISERDFARLSPLAGKSALAEELGRAIVVPSERMPGNVVRMHSRVTYIDEGTGQRREVELVFPEQADPARARISVLAPVGCALLGLEEGQAVDCFFPEGQLRRLRVQRTVAPAG